MNRKNANEFLKKYLEEEIPPSSIHLWPGLERSLVAKEQSRLQQGVNKMKRTNPSRFRLTWAASITTLVILVGVFFLATPQGRVLAQEIVNFFTRSSGNEQAVPRVEASLQPQSGELSAPQPSAEVDLEQGCGTVTLPRCDLAAVQSEVSFEIQNFNSLPENMQFIGATTLDQGAVLTYRGDYGDLILLEEMSLDGNTSGTWTVGKDATIQSTSVQQSPAEFVQGTWTGLLQGGENSMVSWDESIPTRTLRWRANDINFTLVNFPAQGIDHPIGYDLDEMKQLAGTIGSTADTSIASLPQDGLTLSQAEESAGFTFALPANIPTGLALYKTTYDSQHNSICEYYRGESDDPAYPTLVIGQSTWALPTVAELQTKAYYGDKQVPIAISQQAFTIAGADGGQGQFIETGLQIDAFCGGSSTTTHRVLLWQQGNHTFALFARLDSYAGTSFVSKLELQHMAEELNGAAPEENAGVLDPERLNSLKDAETVAGFEIEQPTTMLSNVRFDHISVAALMGYPMQAVSQYVGDEPIVNGVERLTVFQIPNSTSSLDDLRQAGGYSDLTIKGLPAIYNEECSNDPLYGNFCFQYLSWFEGNTEFSIGTNFSALVPLETLLAIANSMQ